MKRTNSRIPRTLRNQILREYLTSDLSASEIAARYDISPKTIDTWKHRYVYQKERVPLLKRQETTSNNSNDMNRKKDNTSYSPEVMELKEEIRKLQVALRQSELERLALDTMIDIAEEQGIRIRKKLGPNGRPAMRAGRPVRRNRLQTVGHCRQAYYQTRGKNEERLRNEERIVSAVKEIRGKDPGIGGYKLWLMLKAMFDRSRMPGRDAFLELLRRRKLLSHRPRPRCTTKSNHHYRKWKNLIKGMIPDAANQLWVSDITYIDTDAGNTYLHLVTDAYSKKIVGWRLSQTLEAENTLAALRMAIRQSGMSDLSGLTHHSDRGVNIAATPMWKSCSCTISQ